MTDPVPTRNGSEFDALLRPAVDAATVGATRPGRRWPTPAVALALAALGASALIAAALGPGSSSAAPAGSASPAPPAPLASSAPAGTATPGGSTAAASNPDEIPISELADPDWVKRIAAEGDIPDRALAAYAGAALSVAQTDPSCGIGWNTIAAIGEVESEHGTMNGAHLDSRGVAVPTIIGVPLDGHGTEKVPDTDHGQYDGDTTWDHAVGPMQFLPSTWAQVGQDGNKDGVKDINQIDDAALAAAMHLCKVGGDLRVARNWIAAIGAYNSAVDYNNRVAALATRYASLR